MRSLPLTIIAIVLATVVVTGCGGGHSELSAPVDAPNGFQAQKFTIPPGQIASLSFNELEANTVIEGYFTVDQNDITFQVTDRRGRVLFELPHADGRRDFRYRTDRPGDYRLVFDNANSWFNRRSLTVTFRLIMERAS